MAVLVALLAETAAAEPWRPLSDSFLDIDFQAGRALISGRSYKPSDIVAVDRPSAGWVASSNGVLRKVAPNKARLSDSGLLVEQTRTFSALHNRDLRITHQLRVQSVNIGGVLIDGETVRTAGGGRGIYVAAQSDTGILAIRGGAGAFTGELTGEGSGAKRSVSGQQQVWQAVGARVTRDRPGRDLAPNAASRIVALADNATVLQRLTVPEQSSVLSVQIRRLRGEGVIEMTTDGNSWVPIDVKPGWTWPELSPLRRRDLTIGLRLRDKADEIAVDFVALEDGLSRTSPMDVTMAPVRRMRDRVTMPLTPYAATFPILRGGLRVAFYGSQHVQSAAMVSLHTEQNDVDRMTVHGGGIYQMFGLAFISDGSGYGVDPEQPYARGHHVFSGAFDAGTERAAVSLDGGPVVADNNPDARRWPVKLRHMVFGYSYGAGGPPLNGYVKRVSLTRTVPTDALLRVWSGGDPQ